MSRSVVCFSACGFKTRLEEGEERRNTSFSGTSDSQLRKYVDAKFNDASISGAVRIVSSDDSVAPCTGETASALKGKHPPKKADSECPLQPQIVPVPPFTVEDMKKVIHDFPNGGREVQTDCDHSI